MVSKIRMNWIQWGNRNTAYFRAKIIARQKRSIIELLQDDKGDWVEDQESLKALAYKYFRKLYQVDGVLFL